jgi:23S rRNA C2498 (ribose-2'-O)-methylase RlmM
MVSLVPKADHLVKIDWDKLKNLNTMAQDEKIFADGFSFKRNEKAPDFVVGRMSIKEEEGIAFIKKHVKNGWVNFNIKIAKSGNYYVELDTYEPTTKPQAETKSVPAKVKKAPLVVESEEELPF